MPKPDPTLHYVSDAELEREVRRVPEDEFVIWTGGRYGNRDSLRFNALSGAVRQPGQPVSVRAILEHAARRDGMRGYPPAKVRQGIDFHMGSKPAVYVWVRRGADGVFRTIRDAAWIDTMDRNVRAGTPVDPRRFAGL